MNDAQRLRVKVCGMTRSEDAARAAELGAWAIGLVFWPGSPRCVATDTARHIVAALPERVLAVGVFVNQPPVVVARVANEVALDAIQLHGDERIDDYLALGRPILRAVPSEATVDEVERWPAGVLALVDAHDPERRGGTGRRADWTRAATLARRRPVVLAGGLTAENVSAAVAAVSPMGVDVSSGVESAPGVKDHARLSAFFEAVAHSGAVRRPENGLQEVWW